jgi:hypothetical protein
VYNVNVITLTVVLCIYIYIHNVIYNLLYIIVIYTHVTFHAYNNTGSVEFDTVTLKLRREHLEDFHKSPEGQNAMNACSETRFTSLKLKLGWYMDKEFELKFANLYRIRVVYDGSLNSPSE